jgi:hypothetical protein
MSSKLSKQPLQIRLPEDLEDRIERIADLNHLSKPDVIRLCLRQQVPVIEQKGLHIPPQAV